MVDRNEVLRLDAAQVEIGEKRLLCAISLAIQRGERVVILGANGAGKSTLLRLAHGLIAPTRGNRESVPAAQQRMLFQRPPLLRTTALGNVQFALRASGMPTQRIDTLAAQALAACGLAAFATRHARSLSGGEQQRLALACAWACAPALLFADEPTASLDLNAVREVEHALLKLNADGAAIVLTTHSLAQARRLAQRIIFLHDGQLTDDLPAAQFFAGNRSQQATLFIEGEVL